MSTEAQKRASAKWQKNNMRRIPFDVSFDKYDELKNHVDSRNETMRGFILRAIEETIIRDNEK